MFKYRVELYDHKLLKEYILFSTHHTQLTAEKYCKKWGKLYNTDTRVIYQGKKIAEYHPEPIKESEVDKFIALTEHNGRNYLV